MNKKVLGVDIGGVIIDRVNDDTDTSFFSDNYLKTTPTPGVFDALSRLVRERFNDGVHLVSKCGKKTQEKTRRWLDHHNFYEVTGIKREHVHFCRERHQKAGICEKIGATHFVDDRLEILGGLTMVGSLYLFQPNEVEVRKYACFLSRVTRVDSWAEVLKKEFP